jgi:hypothetical protein
MHLSCQGGGRLSLGGLQFQACVGKEVPETPTQWKKLGMGVHACHPSYSGKHKIGGSSVQANLGKKQDPISKITRAKRTGGMA